MKNIKEYSIYVRTTSEEEARKEFKERIDSMHIEEKDLPTDWDDHAGNYADNIFEERKSEIDDAYNKCDEKTLADEEIYNEIDQELDPRSIVHEYCDMEFVYNDTESLNDALQCIHELDDYEETDAGLWEGLKTIEEEINARAFWTFSNAVNCMPKDKIIDYIKECQGEK